MAVRQGRGPLEGRARLRLGGPSARQGGVPVPHNTAPFSLGGHPRGVAGMGPGLTRTGGGGGGLQAYFKANCGTAVASMVSLVEAWGKGQD